tara:strand:+ start:730 stop:996 length:267 start_codon:yes stop_codon:yes gene_type:complete
MNKLQPFYDNVLIKRRELGNESSGGIIITVQEGESNTDGKVVKVGPDCKVVKVGDHVLFDALNGTVIPVGDEDLVFISEESLMGKYHE